MAWSSRRLELTHYSLKTHYMNGITASAMEDIARDTLAPLTNGRGEATHHNLLVRDMSDRAPIWVLKLHWDSQETQPKRHLAFTAYVVDQNMLVPQRTL